MMEKSIFEQIGGTYTEVNGYLLPNLVIPDEELKPIGIWGQRHLRYIKQHKRALYTSLLLSGQLNSYLADLDEQAKEMFQTLEIQLAERDGITERLKAENQMEWVRRMNACREQAKEIVNAELIYS